MKYKENPILSELIKWLKNNATPVYESLNEGIKNVPPSWPQAVQNYYLLHNGQTDDSTFLFPDKGNWFSLERSIKAHQIWLDMAESYGWEWYKKEYVPIVGYMEQMESATVVNIKTGKIGNVDIELQEFELVFDSIDDLFADLLRRLKKEGYPPEEIYTHPSEEQLEASRLADALKMEEEYRKAYDNPSPEELYGWGKSIFRQYGDPAFRDPNLPMMKLAKKYFDQISLAELSGKQIREIMFFEQRYKQLVK